jgi:Transmembrane domain of unknown function (DUF3566)
VSSPNDPGYPGAGDPANGSGPKPGPTRTTGSGPLSTAGAGPQPNTGKIADPSDAPPWQRSRAARARQPQRRPPDPPGPPAVGPENRENREVRDSRETRPVDNRTTRFPSASAASPTTIEPDGPAREAYPSELPDLSGPLPRPGPRKPPLDRLERPEYAGVGSSARSTSRMQVAARSRGPVRASMQIRRVDPWSVLKVSLVLSVALFFVWMIAVAFLYLVLGGMGVWSKLNSNVGDLLTNTNNGGQLVSSGAIFGGAALIGLVNIVLLTAMATVGAFIYNLTTDLVGGVEVTLADRD